MLLDQRVEVRLVSTSRYLASRSIREPGLRQPLVDGMPPQRRAAIELAPWRETPLVTINTPRFERVRHFLGQS